MSAPPIGSVMVMPSRSASAKNSTTACIVGWPAITIDAPSASVAATITRLTNCWPLKRKLRLIRPWSLPKAISEPEKLTAPMKAPAAASAVTTGPCVAAAAGSADAMRRSSTAAIAAAAPPPMPL